MKLKGNLAGRDLLNKLIDVVSVVGPTASGKTKISVELAKHFNGEIVSADSMQIYKGMQIATAKPDLNEMGGIKHHLMDFLSPDKTYSVAEYVKDAGECIEKITSDGKLPFIVGGTGLYVDSLLNNISFGAETRNPELCEELMQIYIKEGIDKLLSILNEFDSEAAQRLSEQKNVKRIIRAIEIYKTTGVTITEQNKNSRLIQSPYRAVKIGLNFNDRQALYDRINLRVDLMLQQGLLEEAERVLNSELSFTSVKAIGYKELEPYFKGERSLEDCIEKLKMETRRYAKRQLTWFRRDTEISWLYVDSYENFEDLLKDAITIIEERRLSVYG